jgi:PAS domain S-box-containing protein
MAKRALTGGSDSVTGSSPARILLVDDDERNLLALGQVLEGLADVVTATSGGEALRHLLDGEFAVILLDVFMPGMDGYETAQLIRQRKQTARIPIIFLSAVNKETEHLMRGYSMGAVDYVFKPVDAVILQSKVKVFVDLFRMRAEVEEKRRREQMLLDANLKAKSEKLKVERELRLVEQRQAAIIQSLPIVLYLEPVGQKTRRPSFVGDNLARVTGYTEEDVEGDEEFWESRLHTDDRDRVLAELKGRRRASGWSIHYRWRCADGSYRHLHDQAVLIRGRDGRGVEYAGSLFDVSERRELESQLLQAQKMDAIGQLTGGVAHDFNNLLASILGGLHLLQRRLSLGERDRLVLDQMRHAAEQGAELIRRMMAFARKQELSPASIDPKSLCESVAGLVAPTLGGRVQVHWECPAIERFLFVDRSQLELALVNLIINARDAMPDGGKVRVSIGEKAGDGGAMIRIAVADEGLGIPAEIIDRVTEPFFTTKEAGKGTGLGLSMVAGFVEQSGGQFAVASDASGTRVELLLPSTVEQPRSAPADEPARRPANGLAVLLVDDDEAVRTVIAEQLRDSGTSVVEAASGDEAIAAIERAGPRFDVILSDYAMPGRNGIQTIKAVRAIQPAIGAVVMTGYADDETVEALGEDIALLRKPVPLGELLSALAAQAASGGGSRMEERTAGAGGQ